MASDAACSPEVLERLGELCPPLTEARLAEARAAYAARGFVQVDGLLTAEELAMVRRVYDDILQGRIDAARHRYDLGAGAGARKVADVENVTQVMWPHDLSPEIAGAAFNERARAVAAALYGDDSLAFDFSMLIAKAPHTDTATPFHQDASYWHPGLADTRAVSFWVALDASTLDNGCMWYAPGSHLEPALRPHARCGDNPQAALCCPGSEAECEPMPLAPGSAGLHSGRTVHYSRGNTTSGPRRALILNFRPQAAIDFFRAHGFDHGRAGNKENAVRTTA